MSTEMRNVKPQVWGPSFWRMLHTIAYAYPEAPTQAQKSAVTDLLNSLKQLLPCAKCRAHYTEYLDTHAWHQSLDSRDALARFVYQFHEDVNGRLGKQCCKTFEQCEQKYLYGDDTCGGEASSDDTYGAESYKWFFGAAGIVLFLFLAYELFRGRNRKLYRR